MTLYRRLIAGFAAALMIIALCAASAETPAEYNMEAPQNLAPGHLYAQSALLVDEDSGEVLFSKNSRVRMYPASTTKIMTLLLALESDIPLDAQVTIPADAADIPDGSSVIPVEPGDVVGFGDLLYAFMLSSGNDGANAIAVLVDGSREAFVEHMNARAAELGLEGTHYVNAHGYHDPRHYTTASDLAALSLQAMKNDTFRKIVAQPRWSMQILRGGESVATEIISRNSLLQSDQKYYYPACTGIKTGHHNKAGWCFVGSAERDGMRVICVVLDCEQENDKWYDAARLFEYGFTRYEGVSLAALLDRAADRFDGVRLEDVDERDPQGGVLRVDMADLEGGEREIKVVSGSAGAMDAAIQRVSDAVSVSWSRELRAPVSEGERMGSLELELDGGIRATAALVASRDVAARKATTAAPTVTAVVEREAPRSPEGDAAHGGRGSGIKWILAALIALLLAALAALFFAAHRERRRRAARRRRRRSAARAARRPR